MKGQIINAVIITILCMLVAGLTAKFSYDNGRTTGLMEKNPEIAAYNSAVEKCQISLEKARIIGQASLYQNLTPCGYSTWRNTSYKCTCNEKSVYCVVVIK